MTIALFFLLILVVFVLFVTEVVAPDLIALGVLVLVALVGWVTPKEAFAALSNEAPVTVAAMFILSSGLQRCGAIEDIGRLLRRLPNMTELKLLVLLMVSVAACSAFVNNTPVVVALLPLVLGVARHYDVSASKLLIPLSYAAILGGTCSLIGTSTNSSSPRSPARNTASTSASSTSRGLACSSPSAALPTWRSSAAICCPTANRLRASSEGFPRANTSPNSSSPPIHPSTDIASMKPSFTRSRTSRAGHSAR